MMPVLLTDTAAPPPPPPLLPPMATTPVARPPLPPPPPTLCAKSPIDDEPYKVISPKFESVIDPPVAACPPLAPKESNPAEAPAEPPDPPTDWALMPKPPIIVLVRVP